MQTTPPNDDMIGAPSEDSTAFARLASLPPGTDKNTLISTIDSAVNVVVSELTNHEKGELPGDLLLKVQTSLTFLEQCLAFKDEEFTSFAKKRANEVQMALSNTLARITEKAKKPEPAPEPEPAPVAEEPAQAEIESEAAPKPDPAPAAAKEEEPEEEEPFDPKAFPYPREEKILVEYAFERLSKRLAFLRGDHFKADRGEPVLVSGIHEDGVPPFFLISPDFPKILEPAFKELIEEKRDLLSRRIYIHTDKDDSDEEVRTLYAETYHRDIDGILALAFDDWSGEVARAGIAGAGLPQEIKVLGPKKKEEEASGGIGSSLKKVFSFGGKKDKKKTTKTKVANVPDRTPIRVHKEWQALENKGVFSLSQHFSYSMISYAIQLNEKQFDTEYECIAQIVNQQEEPDVGPVITNLSRLYKFYDNIFFDLVILVLFQRKNAFDINMLQAACMSQNFVVDRLPLTMDELRRRPMEHAKRIIATLKDGEDKDTVKQALVDYFHVHETIHASKVGKRIQASENLIKRQAEKMDGPTQNVLKEVLNIFNDINNFKAQQEEEGVFLGEEILECVSDGIDRAILFLS
ncbi:hypothetical protein RYZ26_14335 [Terasakiella sp. A23]|uniref:hypothetical protein n=1 Tax=Terasakiella sp. FCG-A23 TaxID=3080561 RepID=UPI0029554791|nr:hypothetical protein [Terasakiella sp. A23]MDV7340780.1 hypothetical protein [Terasakiella sp. A23]